MAGLDAGLDRQGALFDGDPLWNMEDFMPVRMGAEPTLFMSPSETRDQIMLGTDRFIIDELINGLMADTKLWML